MAYNNNYKFARPFTKNGKEAKWHQVVEFIKANGPISKREIIKAIWHYDKDLKKWTTYEHKENPIHMSKPAAEDTQVILNLVNTNYIKDVEDKMKMLEKSIENLKNILSFMVNTTE